MTKTAVVALGGNALTRKGQAGTCEEMTANAAEMAASVGAVIQAGWRVMIVHGNGRHPHRTRPGPPDRSGWPRWPRG
jgi:carbamate kinase